MVSCNNGFQSIPVELVVEILLYLQLRDLASCRRVNRRLNSTIENSQIIQHQIDAAIDNPDSTLSLSGRRDALYLRQQAWDTCKPQHTTTYETCPSDDGHPLTGLVVQNGIYFMLRHDIDHNQESVAYRPRPQPNQPLDGKWSYLTVLQRNDHCKTVDFAVSLENDLVAVGIQ